jgi:ATP-dependent exoDNAse (exonuclease V) beta subunit
VSASESERALAELARFERDLVVQAGAGTGKTHALVTLYLHLLAGLGERTEALPPSRVLVITFTDKAAAELRERIRDRLGTLCERGLDADAVLRASAARRGRGLPDEGFLRRALAELPRAPIGTFHAFGHALLRRHALAAGLAPDFALLDEGEAQQRALAAARAAVLEGLEAGDETAALVELYGFEPRAHGGIVNAIARLRARRAEEGRDAGGMAAAYQPLRMAAERARAATALREALRAFAGLEDSVGDGSRPKLAELAAVAATPELEDERALVRLGAIRELMKNLRGNKRGGAEVVAETKRRCTDALEALGDAERARQAAPLAARIEALVDGAERRYAAAKRAAGAVDFADLLVLPRDLLRDRPEIAAAEGGRHAALLVDEFQDTSRVQAELIERLRAAAPADGAGRCFVVGDRKQAIYEFRGADVAVFAERTEAMKAAGAGEVLLRRSYRSTPGVVALCNELFARAFVGAGDGGWSLRWGPERDPLEAHRSGGVRPGAELLRSPPPAGAPDHADALRRLEARAIAERMRALVDGGRRPGDLALLLRRYTHLQRYLDALRAAELPHYVVHGRGFYEAQEIRDLASLIAWLHDEDDRFAMVAVLRSPLCGLSDTGLARLAADGALGGSLLRASPSGLDPADAAALAELVARVRPLRGLRGRLGPADLLRELLDVFDLRAVLAATPEGSQRIANLEQLIARAEALAEDPLGPAADLPSFARWLARAVRPLEALEAAGAQIVDERDDVVRVMTVHQAKGLQFPVVFVADCGAREREPYAAIGYDPELGLGVKIAGEVPGKLFHTTPSRRVEAVRVARAQAESLRLFYVAATRAQDLVVFSGEAAGGGASWRAQLDRLAADPAAAHLLAPIDRVPRRATQLALALQAPPPPPATGEVPLALVPLAATRARAVRVAVTQLQDFSLCARRYHLFHELRIDEHPSAARAAPDDDDAAAMHVDPLRAGTLAHRLLERARFGLAGAEATAALRGQLAAEGYAPDDPAVAEIEAHVLRFLLSDFARGLADRPLRRELPFALALGAGPRRRASPDGVAEGSGEDARVLRGQIDLLVFSDDGVDVLDYKHARRGDLADHRFQLETYALAVATLYPRAPRVRVGLAFLREADPQPVWVEVDPIEAIAARLGETLDRFAAARVAGERPGIARPGCERLHCGYLSWCHADGARP